MYGKLVDAPTYSVSIRGSPDGREHCLSLLAARLRWGNLSLMSAAGLSAKQNRTRPYHSPYGQRGKMTNPFPPLPEAYHTWRKERELRLIRKLETRMGFPAGTLHQQMKAAYDERWNKEHELFELECEHQRVSHGFPPSIFHRVDGSWYQDVDLGLSIWQANRHSRSQERST